MTEKLIDKNGVISLGSIDKEKDLKPEPGININPPPPSGRCECCRKHISELRPFGGPGDPLVGDFTGEYLVKGWRDFGGCVCSTWECRDCFVLNEDEFLEKLKQTHRS